MSEHAVIQDIAATGTHEEQAHVAETIARSWDRSRVELESLLDAPAVRRWVRAHLLERLSASDASELAGSLLNWHEDYRAERRDRSTVNIVAALTGEQLQQHLPFLASSNCAGALWQRIAHSGPDVVMNYVQMIFRTDDPRARETTLHLLVLDPYGPEYLPHEAQNAVLKIALQDPDPEIRGLGAEVIAAELPETLIDLWDSAPLDDSERVRMAFWRAAMVNRPNDAIEAAGILALDTGKPHESRRTALLALGENFSTPSVSPVLQSILRGDDEVLAEDAAQLMWRFHRTPDIANAAADSQFTSVQAQANRLLHPEIGSPAAGGSRPGDPTRTTDFFEQFATPDDNRNDPYDPSL
jgi:hypothetical protein